MRRATGFESRGGARALFALGLFALGVSLTACVAHVGPGTHTSLAELRSAGSARADDETLARWLLGELLSPGGNPERMRAARARLDEQHAQHYLAHLARGLDDAWHGRLASAPGHFWDALEAARHSATLEARLVAWFAASQAAALSDHAPGLWVQSRARVEALIEHPEGIGWRARAHLVQWWLDETTRSGETQLEQSLPRLGCITTLRLAGPFGSAAPVHLQRHFPPEAPGPWPQRWPEDASSAHSPEIIGTTRHGCEVLASDPVLPGVFYAETYLELPDDEELILAAQGALALWVDDRLVLDRDPRKWGVWARFGAHLGLHAGRHRVLARLSEPRTLLRAMHPDGTPLTARASIQATAPYRLAAPELLSDPNDLMQFIGPDGARPGLDDVTRFLAAELAHLEGEDDVASVLFQPLVEPLKLATGPALSSLAEWVSGDLVIGHTEATDRVRSLEEAAVARDPELWRPQIGLALAKANTGNLADAVAPLRKLSERFPDVPAVWNALGVVYGRLGWKPEQGRVTLELARRFGDAPALAAAAAVYEDRGDDKAANDLLARAAELDASLDVRVERALRRRDYPEALREIDRLLALAPHRKAELTRRRQEIQLAAGDESVEAGLLESAIRENPVSGPARLALADARFATGDGRALHQGLAESIQAGAGTDELGRAIDAVEARSEFAPLRLDGRTVIRDYERAGRHQSGTAERVLDYAAVWVHSDGSSRMLEHEIVRVQSEEAISKFAEHQRLAGLVLNMRVIKRDGRTLEPEAVAGKPSVTFPHLEVGDYIETEHVQGAPAEEQGRSYTGLRWFFREEDVAYARSEFVLIAPVERPLDIEITGKVPAPEEKRDGHFVTRRWRVDESPAAPVEPLSAPVQEFLPSVRVGWGNGLERRLRVLSEQVADTLPVDPRIRALGLSIVAPLPESQALARARKAYRWVQDNIKDGQEVEGARILTSKQGNRWSALRMLLRALDIPVRYAVIQNRLAPPAPGPMSDAESYNVPLLQVGSGQDSAWLTLQDKFAPFGYVPVEARGMPGHELSVEGQTPVQVPAIGDQDRLEYEGTVKLALDGGARITLRQRFLGKYAIRLRAGLEQVPESRLREVVESRLLGQAFPGAELVHFSIEAREDVDAPLVVEMEALVGKFAEVRPDGLVIDPPLMPHLTRLTALPERQTPLLIAESMHQSSRLRIELPPGLAVEGTVDRRVEDAAHWVGARDRVEGQTLILDREVSIAAGRIPPVEYARFSDFTRAAERLLSQSLVLGRARSSPQPAPTSGPQAHAEPPERARRAELP